MKGLAMTAIHVHLHSPWVVGDGSVSVMEALAVIGALIWIIGLLWLVLGDAFRVADHSHKKRHPDETPPDRHTR